MGLIGKLFGSGKDGAASVSPPASAQFHESEPEPARGPSKGARRRELVQVVLRETMREHGIPSDWIESRVLSVVGSASSSGAHITFIVRRGEDRLLTYVHAFEKGFARKLRQFEPRAMDWVLSLSWQFSGDEPAGEAEMPQSQTWAPDAAQELVRPVPAAAPQREPKGEGRASPASATREAPAASHSPAPEDEELQEDLQALFAIRDAALKSDPGPAEVSLPPRGTPPSRPRPPEPGRR